MVHFVVVLKFVFSHDEINAKRGKVAKKPRPIKISLGRASHFVALTADICITEEFSIRLKLDTYIPHQKDPVTASFIMSSLFHNQRLNGETI